jgi:hypothetical protein
LAASNLAGCVIAARPELNSVDGFGIHTAVSLYVDTSIILQPEEPFRRRLSSSQPRMSCFTLVCSFIASSCRARQTGGLAVA